MPRVRFDPHRLLGQRMRGRAIASLDAEVRDGVILAEAGAAPPAGRGDRYIRHYRVAALIIACAMFMETLDATVLTTALPAMARDFALPAPELSIALTSYLLALAIFIPASAAVADRLGAKRAFQAAIALFLLGSLVCGLSPNVMTFVIARFVQGAGGALMVPIGRLVLLRSVEKHELVSAMSWLIMPALVGPIVGPPLGGFIVTYFAWRWIFWLNLPIGLVGILLVGRFIAGGRDGSPRSFDRIGFLLTSMALGCLLFGFELTGHAGSAGPAGALVSIGILAGILYLRHAGRVDDPILDMSLLRIPTFRLSLLGGSLTRITQGAHPFLLPLMMQFAFGLNAAQSGAMTLATALGSFGMKGLAPHILRRFGYRTSLIWFGVLSPLAYMMCGFFRPGWPMAGVFAVMLVSGFLMSFQFTAYNTIAYDEIEPERMSAATSFYSTFQQLMLSLGICAGAAALHISMALNERSGPAFMDFTAAFLTVTFLSLLAVFTNIRFDRTVGAGIIGQPSAQQ